MKAHNEAQSVARALIRRVVNGESRAYREFEARYRRLVYAVLRRSHVCQQDGDDIYQELYIRLWGQERRRLRLWMESGTGEFNHYLTVIVRNVICDWYRCRISTSLTVDPATDDAELLAVRMDISAQGLSGNPDERLLRDERASAVREAIGRLRARDADLIRRRYYVEQSYQEIAEALDISVGSVGVALSHARQRLGRHLFRMQSDLFEANPSSQTRQDKQSRPRRRRI